MKIPMSLRIWVPALLVAVALISSILVEWSGMLQAREAGVQATLTNLRYLLQSKQATLERLMSRQDMTAARAEIAALRFDRNVLAAMLIAPDGRIVIATEKGVEGRMLREHAHLWPTLHLEDTKFAREAVLHVDEAREYAHAVYPIVTQIDQRAMRETINGMLVLNYDLRGIEASAWRGALHRLTQTAATLLIVALICSWLLRQFITLRINMLIGATERVAAGDFTSTLQDVGESDELARLTRAVNAMTRSLARQREALSENEQRLRESEARLRAIIQAEPECVKLVAPDGSLSEMNRAGLDMIEAESLDQVKGVSVFDLIVPEHRAEFMRLHQSVLGGVPAEFDYDIITTKGNRRSMSTHAVPFTAHDGTVMHLGITADVTERKRMLDEQDGLRAQLRQAQKMEAIGQLTGGIAHDFNNILGAILGYSGLALDRFGSQLPPKVREYLVQVRDASLRARDLIAQMLAFSRGIDAEPVSTQIGPLVKEASKLLQATLPSSIEIDISVEKDLRPVMIDPVQLHQVVMNLCINARDAMAEKGRLGISVETCHIDSAVCASCHHAVTGEFIELAIRDTGKGIAADVLPRIFDPFFTTKEIGRGTGMGLSMVHGIVHHFQGHVLVATQAGEGTVFRVLLPAAVTPAGGQAPEHRAQAAPAPSAARIMLVDDEVALLRFMAELLSSHGFRVETFSSSAEALATLERSAGQYALLITDQTMPGMTGVELARRAYACDEAIATILVSGYGPGRMGDDPPVPNVCAVLQKPIATEDLLNAVEAALTREPLST